MAEKPTFEESIAIIDNEINKRRGKWTLTAIAWMDYEDVAQILRIHINNKWHLYDHNRPLAPWVNAVISSQIKNLIRNNYGNYSRPCLKCAAAEGGDACRIFLKQCAECPLYARWEKTKKRAHDSKLPVSLENHSQEVHGMPEDSFDILKAAKHLHAHMEKILKPIEWRVYKYLYIDEKKEEDVAEVMGYRTSEKNRPPGYKTVKTIKKTIIDKVKKHIYSGGMELE